MSIIKPIVEFYPVEAVLSKGGVNMELFPTDSNASTYRQGLRKALDEANGIYVFYDTRGRALYAGKARRQSLWKEMRFAFNRDRTQQVYRVKHPTVNKEFKGSDEIARKIAKSNVRLSRMSGYFSAYEVSDDLIDTFEALIVRAFANDLLNSKMENF